ncbi:Octopine catabolism/uptake operon regulatory protein OccR [Burkholderiales bacterium]|nr:Octopine catabolism/uptake operon regulatory protein OccR [Burkholderiales bacterium]
MINLRHVEVFYAIMRAGSITEAARILNVTQPAVSVALKHLESRLRMKLFDRSGGRLRPTPEAKALLPDVAEIFGRLGAVERLSQDLAGGARGVLSIAATPPLCDGFVAKAVATFVAKRPGVKISLQSLASPIVLDRVVNREVDLGVVYEPVVSAAVHTEEVMRASIGCVMPARHPLAKRATVRARDLAPYPVVTYLPQALLRPHIDRFLSEKASPIAISVETGTSSTAIMLAAHGAGVALIETALFAARPVPGFVMRPVEPRIELRSLLLRPRLAAASRVLDPFVAHLRATAIA